MKKLFAVWALGAVTTILLSACGLSPEQKALNADCDLIAERVSKYIDVVDTDSVEGWSWSSGYAVTNAGVESRQQVISQSESLYPFFPAALQNIIAANPDTSSYEYQEGRITNEAIRLAYVSSLLEGTKFELKFTPEELSLIYSGKYDGSALLETKITEVFGENYPETKDEEGKCAGADMPSIKKLTSEYPYDSSPNVLAELYQDSREYMSALGVAYVESQMCQTTGNFGGKACAATDYVSAPSEWTPTTRDPFVDPYGDETTQGLAEFAWCYNLGLEVNPSRTGCW